ncbi:MAG: CoA-binding protein, partial [Candidatus Bathyarchaeia archaeon]
LKGVRAVIIFSSGFGETGEEGAKLQKQVEEMVKQSGILMLGPNCVGVYNVTKGYNLTMSPTLNMLRGNIEPGEVGFITQSGAFGVALFTLAVQKGLRLSKMIHLGNKVIIKDADVLEYLCNDDATKVIVMYLEDVKEGRKVLNVLKKVTQNKPVVAVRVL